MEKYDHSDTQIARLGDAFIALGSAMKDPNTRLSELAIRAHDAGVRISFDFTASDEVPHAT